MTPEEEEVFELLGSAFTKFKKLTPEHLDDEPEFIAAIHAAQNIVLSRLAYRAYLDKGR